MRNSDDLIKNDKKTIERGSTQPIREKDINKNVELYFKP